MVFPNTSSPDVQYSINPFKKWFCYRSEVAGFVGDDLKASLEGMEIVVIPAGVPRKPGMTRDDLFNTNASIVANLGKANF